MHHAMLLVTVVIYAIQIVIQHVKSVMPVKTAKENVIGVMNPHIMHKRKD